MLDPNGLHPRPQLLLSRPCEPQRFFRIALSWFPGLSQGPFPRPRDPRRTEAPRPWFGCHWQQGSTRCGLQCGTEMMSTIRSNGYRPCKPLQAFASLCKPCKPWKSLCHMIERRLAQVGTRQKGDLCCLISSDCHGRVKNFQGWGQLKSFNGFIYCAPHEVHRSAL